MYVSSAYVVMQQYVVICPCFYYVCIYFIMQAAYEEAKKLVHEEFTIVVEQFESLFKLQTPESDSLSVKHEKAMQQSQQLLESFHKKPLNEKVYQVATYMYVHVCTCTYTYFTHVGMCVHTYIHICTYKHTYCTYLHMYNHMYVYAHTYICICTCVHTYRCSIYVHAYTHTQTHTLMYAIATLLQCKVFVVFNNTFVT